jgi:hypothetical protein
MRIKIQYVFPDIPDTFSTHEMIVETDSDEYLTIVRQSSLEPRTYTKEIVQTQIDGQTVSALIEWLP